jgi:hypothetical protein
MDYQRTKPMNETELKIVELVRASIAANKDNHLVAEAVVYDLRQAGFLAIPSSRLMDIARNIVVAWRSIDGGIDKEYCQSRLLDPKSGSSKLAGRIAAAIAYSPLPEAIPSPHSDAAPTDPASLADRPE